MRTVTSWQEMEALGRGWRKSGESVGFVPTMGFLHAGHTSLMKVGRERSRVLVASIFVNPLQFGPQEDLARYPRDPEGDSRACEASGVDVLFMPPELYPPGFRTRIVLGGVSERWEGAARPGHFEGVATVVARLFGLVQPTLAVFGEKDFQQLAVVQALVRDLALGVEIVPGSIVRDGDGLALSSRNVYLSEEQRRRARSIPRAVEQASKMAGAGVQERLDAGRALLEADSVDYFAIVDAETLEPVQEAGRRARVLVTARYGSVRLLDNAEVVW